MESHRSLLVSEPEEMYLKREREKRRNEQRAREVARQRDFVREATEYRFGCVPSVLNDALEEINDFDELRELLHFVYTQAKTLADVREHVGGLLGGAAENPGADSKSNLLVSLFARKCAERGRQEEREKQAAWLRNFIRTLPKRVCADLPPEIDDAVEQMRDPDALRELADFIFLYARDFTDVREYLWGPTDGMKRGKLTAMLLRHGIREYGQAYAEKEAKEYRDVVRVQMNSLYGYVPSETDKALEKMPDPLALLETVKFIYFRVPSLDDVVNYVKELAAKT